MLILISILIHVLIYLNHSINWTQKAEPPLKSCSMDDYTKAINDSKRPGFAISGQPISVHQVVSRIQCGDLCSRHPSCEAYNLEEFSTSPSGTRTCELMENLQRNASSKPNYAYWLFNQTLFTKVGTMVY